MGQGVTRLDQLCGFFLNFVDHLIGAGPIEPNARRPFLQFVRAQQRRQPHRNAVQRATLGFAGTLGCFDRFPISGLLLGRFFTGFVAKNMWVPRHHFVGNIAHNRLKREMPQLFAHRRVVDGLQQQIAQFAL